MITSEITVEFIPLPPEMEEDYWAVIRYFAALLHKCMEEETLAVTENHIRER